MHRSGWLLLSLCGVCRLSGDTHWWARESQAVRDQLVKALLVVSCFYQPGRRVLESISKFHESSGFFFNFFFFF